jgi:hypothetical protein
VFSESQQWLQTELKRAINRGNFADARFLVQRDARINADILDYASMQPQQDARMSMLMGQRGPLVE